MFWRYLFFWWMIAALDLETINAIRCLDSLICDLSGQGIFTPNIEPKFPSGPGLDAQGLNTLEESESQLIPSLPQSLGCFHLLERNAGWRD